MCGHDFLVISLSAILKFDTIDLYYSCLKARIFRGNLTIFVTKLRD